MEKIKKYINECEKNLRNLKNSKSEINELVQMSKKLSGIEKDLRAQQTGQEKQEILKEIDTLQFIINSMLDYYNEESSEK